jgi:hypothetical protein
MEISTKEKQILQLGLKFRFLEKEQIPQIMEIKNTTNLDIVQILLQKNFLSKEKLSQLLQQNLPSTHAENTSSSKKKIQ